MSELLLARSAGTLVDGASVVPNDLHTQFDLLAASGGGQAMWPNGFTGRAAPGSMLRPAPHEIWFSSTDAAAPSLHAHAAGLATLALLMDRSETPILTLSPLFDALRHRIAATFGPAGTSVILAPSIASARDLARAIAYSIHGAPAAEISAGAAESQDDIGDTRDVPLRLQDGRAREAREIDHEAFQAARQMASPVLVHVLDQARSGLTGITRAGADAIGREREALTLIDASEMRTSPDCLRWDLEVGRLVLISGSTFLGGHATSAALLVPSSIAARLTHAVPAHLVAEAAAHDMEPEWRDLFCAQGAPRLNIGLGLRWSAALAELDRYLQTPAPLREAILDLFNRRLHVRLSRCGWIERIEQGRGGVTPLILAGASLADAQCLREGLATSSDAPGDAACHLGAPIGLCDGTAILPVSASAPMVSDVADRITRGVSFERAFAPIQRDIDTLVQKIERIWN
jgi:hypothetical protein